MKPKHLKWKNIKRSLAFIDQKIERKLHRLRRTITRKPNYYQVEFVPKCKANFLSVFKISFGVGDYYGLYEPTTHRAQIAIMNRKYFPYKWDKNLRKMRPVYTEKGFGELLTEITLTDIHEFLHYFYEEHEIFIRWGEEWAAHSISEQLLTELPYIKKNGHFISKRFNGDVAICNPKNEFTWIEKEQVQLIKELI